MAHTAPVEAHVTCTDPDTHLVHVKLSLPPSATPGPRTLVMPRWIPGSYKIRDFARHVQDVRVEAGGKERPTDRHRTDGWTFEDPARGRVTVRYSVYCRDLTVDTSHVSASHLYLHGVTAFLYDAAVRDLPWRVTVRVPRAWRLWSGLPLEGDTRGQPVGGAWPPERTGRAVFLADDYDHLVDCPVEAGPHHHEARFRAAGKPHRLVVWNPPAETDWDQVTGDLTKLIEEAAAVFDGLPYRDYTFIAHVAKGHGGGLEHKNSTVLGVDPLHLTDKDLYQTRWLPLCAHEFFHVWNVRRIMPAAFVPFDYQREVPTGLLWLFEGGTSYFEIPLLLRAGIAEPEKVYETLAEMLQWMEAAPGRYRTSVADASRLSWTKLYQRHESNVNTNISYYSKGALVCLCLDAFLRERGANLDQVMRHMWEHYGKTGRGVREDAVANIVKEATGVDVKRVLTQWVERPGDIPVDKSLKVLGLKVTRTHKDDERKLGLGIMLSDTKLRVTNVPDRFDTEDGAWKPGAEPVSHPLDPDDQILAIDGWQVTSKDLGQFLNRAGGQASADVTLFRDGRLITVAVPLVEKTPDKVKIDKDKKAAAAARRRGAAWRRKRRTG